MKKQENLHVMNAEEYSIVNVAVALLMKTMQ